MSPVREKKTTTTKRRDTECGWKRDNKRKKIKGFKGRNHEKKEDNYAQNPNSNREQKKQNQVKMRETNKEDRKI